MCLCGNKYAFILFIYLTKCPPLCVSGRAAWLRTSTCWRGWRTPTPCSRHELWTGYDFLPDADPAFQVIPDPDPTLTLGQVPLLIDMH
jgi:hypothetical protein